MDHWADYVVFILFLVVSLGIGLLFAFTGGKQRTTSEFIMANRNLRVVPTMLSLVVSFISAISIIGYPAEVFKYGVLKFLLSFLSTIIAYALIAQLVVPWLYPLKLTSAFEYFAMRYPDFRPLKIWSVILGLASMVLYMGIVIYAPATAMETATGLSVTWTILLMAGLCTIYTTLGGMKAVIWTDVFQTVILFAGIIAVIIKCLMIVGFARAMELAIENHRMKWYNFDFNPSTRITFWGYMLGGMTWSLSMGISQASVQRISAVGSVMQAKITVLTSIIVKCVFLFVAALMGILTFSYFALKECDPLLTKEISNPNQVLSLFVKDAFKDIPGFSGFFMATLGSGALSSASSALSGCAAVCYKHILLPTNPRMSDLTATKISKCLVVVFGILATGIAYLAQNVPGPIIQVTGIFTSTIGGPVLALFLLGGIRVLRFVRGPDVLAGTIMGVIVTLWIIIGGLQIEGRWPPLPPIPSNHCLAELNITLAVDTELAPITGIQKMYTLSFMWYTSLGAVSSIVFASLVAVVTNRCVKRKELDIPDALFIDFRNIYRIHPITHTIQGKDQPAEQMKMLNTVTDNNTVQ